MIDQKYILLILNCYKYKYKAEIQKKTWLTKLDSNIIYFHVIGDVEKCKTNTMMNHNDGGNDGNDGGNHDYFFDFHNHIIYTKTKDDYLSLPDKIITALKAINSIYHYDYIFKTDDDQELVNDGFFNTLIKLLSSSSKKYNYGGRLLHVNDHYSRYYTVHSELPKKLLLKKTSYCSGRFYFLSNDHYSRYYTVHSELPKKLLLKKTSYCSGRFYFLSKAAVVNLIDKSEWIKEHIIEDHAIGYYMDDDLKKHTLHFVSDHFFRDIIFT